MKPGGVVEFDGVNPALLRWPGTVRVGDMDAANDASAGAPELGSEAAAVARADHPITRAAIEMALRAAGVGSGSTVIVHCSLSKLGWVVGNAVAVVHALRAVVGDAGTIVMPAQTGLSGPSRWQAPPVPESWWPTIRMHWPAFDPESTPLQGMWAEADCFVRLAGVSTMRR